MIRYIGLAIVSALLLAGCNVSGESPVGANGSSAGGHDSLSGIVSWGTWEVTIDPSSATYEIVPLRGAEFMANVTMFLQPPAGSTNNLILKNMAVDLETQPGYTIIEVDVGLKHPFPGLDRYTGFDVRGIFMQDWQYEAEHDPMLTWGGPQNARQLNPDGYSRWMNASEFTTKGILGYTPGALGSKGYFPTATLNPYKYFADGIDETQSVPDFFSDPDSLSDRGCFRPGSVNYRHYSLIWPAGPLTFQYAVIASYVEPDPIPPQNIPEDFPLSANCDEAFNLSISDNGSNAFYVSPDEKGGDLHLKLEVYDWGALGGGTVADQIGQIIFESPGSVMAGPVMLDPTSLAATPGTAVSSVFEIDITGVTPTGLDGQTVLCAVTSGVHETYDYGFGSAISDAPLAAYFFFDAPILGEPSGDAPKAIATACDCLWVAPGGSITFDANQSWSPNGAITKYEWDFDGNGTFGDTFTGTSDHPTHKFNTAGVFDVNLRVTDAIGMTDTLDASEKLQAHVGTFTPPVAKAYISPLIGFIDYAGDFKGSGSTGTINLYEWDFEGDCIWDYQSATVGDTTHAYTLPGYYDPVLRVTGNGCDSETKTVRMIDPLPVLQNGNFWDGQWGAWTHGHGGIPVTYVEELISDETFRHIVHFYRCCTNDGGCCYIYQDPAYDVTSYDPLYLNLFFNIKYDELYGDGWMGGEMAMCVRIVYEDADQNIWQAWIGWDTANDGTWQWDTSQLPTYVKYHYQEVVPSGQWHEKKTIDLKTINPPPAKITRVMIGTWGWDFESYIGPVWFSEE